MRSGRHSVSLFSVAVEVVCADPVAGAVSGHLRGPSLISSWRGPFEGAGLSSSCLQTVVGSDLLRHALPFGRSSSRLSRFFFLRHHFCFYCCSITVVPVFPLVALPCHITALLPESIPTLLSIPMGPLYMFFDLTLLLLCSIIPFPPPLWPLSVCSLFPCLFYFAHFVD